MVRSWLPWHVPLLHACKEALAQYFSMFGRYNPDQPWNVSHVGDDASAVPV